MTEPVQGGKARAIHVEHEDRSAASRAAVGRGAVELPIVSFNEPRIGIRAVSVVTVETVQHGIIAAVRVEFKNGARVGGAAEGGGSVERTVAGLQQCRARKGPVIAVETIRAG